MYTPQDVTKLVNEYRDLFEDIDTGTPDSLEDALTRGDDWTPEVAGHLVLLVKA